MFTFMIIKNLSNCSRFSLLFQTVNVREVHVFDCTTNYVSIILYKFVEYIVSFFVFGKLLREENFCTSLGWFKLFISKINEIASLQ